MGLFNVFNSMINSRLSKPVNNGNRNSNFIGDQAQYEKSWHGVPLNELNNLAKCIYHVEYVKVDQYDFLVIYYTSNSGKTTFGVQCEIENGKLVRKTHNYYPGQWRDAADRFIDEVNKCFTFV